MSENSDRMAVAFRELIAGQPNADVLELGRVIMGALLREAKSERTLAIELAEAMGIRGIVIATIEADGVYIEKTAYEDDVIANAVAEKLHDAMWKLMNSEIGRPVH